MFDLGREISLVDLLLSCASRLLPPLWLPRTHFAAISHEAYGKTIWEFP